MAPRRTPHPNHHAASPHPQTASEMNSLIKESLSDNPPNVPWLAIENRLGAKIAVCNYVANRLACQAADTAIQAHGRDDYSRHLPFKHVWRHFRR
jgi:alkylation response protein AidB-like acyl-CoA dehydrogenase